MKYDKVEIEVIETDNNIITISVGEDTEGGFGPLI